MPIIRAKSKENIIAADLLIKHGMFATSVHCSYYSSFQLSKYVLCHYRNISYQKQDDESRANSMNSHKFVSGKIREGLCEMNRFYSLDYNTYYSKLKMLRMKADYYNESINEDEAKKAMDTANKLTELLTTKYEII